MQVFSSRAFSSAPMAKTYPATSHKKPYFGSDIPPIAKDFADEIERFDLARQLVAVMLQNGQTADMELSKLLASQRFKDEFQLAVFELRPSIQAKIMRFFSDSTKKVNSIPKLGDNPESLAQAYAKQFSASELRDLIKYYNSPEYKAISPLVSRLNQERFIYAFRAGIIPFLTQVLDEPS